MINDYECPKCHNKFPSSNKILHDARCTADNPVPLNKSRLMDLNVQNELNQNLPKKEPEQPKEQKQNIPQVKIPDKSININPPIRKPPSGEFPDVFECNICHQLFMVKEKEDHMLCHNLEKEEKKKINEYEASPEEIAQQKEIERQIERNKRENQNRNNNNNNDNNNRNRRRDDNNFLNSMRNELSRQRGDEINYNPRQNNNNNRQPSNGSNNNNIVISYTYSTIGPNGERITRTYRNNGGNNSNVQINNSINDDMQMNSFFFPSSNRRNRNISFLDLNNNNFGDIFDQFFSLIGNRENPTDQEILNELPETQIEDVNKLDTEKKNCVICLEDFKNGDKACVLPCVHLFHTNCIQQWLKTKNFCPICKFKLTGENINSAQNNMMGS